MDPAQRSDATPSRSPMMLAVFTVAVFVSALLLFAVQPMFTRMVLPDLGGSPSVWSVAMVFFQSMLLGGYAYAHVLMRTRRAAVAVAVHLGLLIAAGLTLPLSIARGWGEPPAEWTGTLAPRPVRDLDRAAVFRAVGQQPPAAGLVRAHRPRGRQGPLFPLRGLQFRKFPGAPVLSRADRADAHASGSEPAVERRLLDPVRADCGVRLSAAALSHARRGRRAGRCNAGAGLADHRPLDVPGRRPLGAPGRRHRAHHDRYLVRSADVGHPALALSADLGAGVPDASAVAASLDDRDPAIRDRGPGRPCLRSMSPTWGSISAAICSHSS